MLLILEDYIEIPLIISCDDSLAIYFLSGVVFGLGLTYVFYSLGSLFPVASSPRRRPRDQIPVAKSVPIALEALPT